MKEQNPKVILKQYVGLKMEVETLREELECAKCDGNSQRVERLIQRIEEEDRRMQEIEEAIDRIPDPMKRAVLRRKYFYTGLQPPTWPEIAAKMCGDNDEKDVQKINRLHGKALQAFSAIYKTIKKSYN